MTNVRQSDPSGAAHRTHVALLIIVLCIGALFRFAELGATRHSYDDSYPSSDAVQMLDTGELAVIGQPSSVFLDNPPLMTYLQAVPMLIARSLWGVYLLIVGLNTIALWFLYDMTRDVLGDTVALLATWLFAINPWVVHFSRTTWVQALVPSFLVLACWGVWPFLVKRRQNTWRFLLGVAAAAAMMLTYVQAFGVLLQIVPLALLFWKRIPRRIRRYAAVIMVVAGAIYAGGVLAEADRNLDKLTTFTEGAAAVQITRDGLDHAARLVSGRAFDAVWAADATPTYASLHRAGQVASTLLEIALVAGALIAFREMWRAGVNRDVARILLIWFLAPVLSMSVSSKPIHPHYLLLSLPAGPILAAWSLSRLNRKALTVGLAFLCIGITVLSGLTLHRANQLAVNAPLNDDFSDWPLRAGNRIGTTVRSLVTESDTTGLPARIVAPGHPVIWRSLSSTYVDTLRGLAYPDFIVLPDQDTLLYVLKTTTGEQVQVPHSLELLDGYTQAFADGTVISFLRTQQDAAETWITTAQTLINWPTDAGLTLVGYNVATEPLPGEALEATVAWRVTDVPPERVERFLTGVYRLATADGMTLEEDGGHGQWGYRWQLGDLYIERVTLTLPTDRDVSDLYLRIGLFDPIHSQTYGLSAPDGWTDAYVVPLIALRSDQTDSR